jgi:hypothetical protein
VAKRLTQWEVTAVFAISRGGHRKPGPAFVSDEDVDRLVKRGLVVRGADGDLTVTQEARDAWHRWMRQPL